MSHLSLLGFALLLCLALASSVSGQVVSMTQNDDSGSLVNCGDNSTKFGVTWSPRVLRPGVTLTLDVSWVTIGQFSHGNLCATIWLQGVEEPIFKDCHDQKCEDAKKAALPYLPISCPVPKGFEINFKKLTYTLQPTIPLPSGKFSLLVSLHNENSVQLLCAKGDVEIIDE
jgi:hypothetical protein